MYKLSIVKVTPLTEEQKAEYKRGYSLTEANLTEVVSMELNEKQVEAVKKALIESL